jgi:hypothetical protein
MKDAAQLRDYRDFRRSKWGCFDQDGVLVEDLGYAFDYYCLGEYGVIHHTDGLLEILHGGGIILIYMPK